MKKKPTKHKMPTEHPKPFQSKLWDHLPEIQELRRRRKTWAEIARHLKDAHGLELSYRTVRNFFLRTRSPKRRIPAGFEEALGVLPKPPSAPPAQPSPNLAPEMEPPTEAR